MEQQTLAPDIQQRNRELNEIAKSISQLAELFKDLSALVIDQGTLLDSVEYNIEQTAVHVQEAVKELNVATRSASACLSVAHVISASSVRKRADHGMFDILVGTRRAPADGSVSSCFCLSSSGSLSSSSSNPGATVLLLLLRPERRRLVSRHRHPLFRRFGRLAPSRHTKTGQIDGLGYLDARKVLHTRLCICIFTALDGGVDNLRDLGERRSVRLDYACTAATMLICKIEAVGLTNALVPSTRWHAMLHAWVSGIMVQTVRGSTYGRSP